MKYEESQAEILVVILHSYFILHTWRVISHNSSFIISLLVRALSRFWKENRRVDWTDRVDFLRAS